jgi:hypothetical protein
LRRKRRLFPLSFREKKAGQRKGSEALSHPDSFTRGVARMRICGHRLFGLCARILPAFAALRRSVATRDEAENREQLCEVSLRPGKVGLLDGEAEG